MFPREQEIGASDRPIRPFPRTLHGTEGSHGGSGDDEEGEEGDDAKVA